MDTNQIKKENLQLMESVKISYLTTIDNQGFPQTRAMLNLCCNETYPHLKEIFEKHKDDMVIYFGTNTDSTKMEDIKANSKASVYFCNTGNFRGVMLSGNIEVITCKETKERFWHESWSMYYPQGKDDPDYTLLKFTPKYARGWHGSFKFRYELEG